MGESRLYVRFPDGVVRYGGFQNTADVVLLNGRLFNDPPFGRMRDLDLLPALDEDTDGAVPVEVWCVYGFGSSWIGRATPTRLLPPHDLLSVDGWTMAGGPNCEPQWVLDAEAL